MHADELVIRTFRLSRRNLDKIARLATMRATLTGEPENRNSIIRDIIDLVDEQAFVARIASEDRRAARLLATPGDIAA